MALKGILWVFSATSLVFCAIAGEEGDGRQLAPGEVDYTLYAAPLLPLDNPLTIQADGKMRRSLNATDPKFIEQQAAMVESRSIPWRFLLGVALATLTYAAIRWRKRPATKVPPPTPQSLLYLDKARSLFGELKGVRSPALVKEYFTALTEAVRYHIEETYDVNATTQTSEEFLKSTELAGEGGKQLKQFLEVCDAVKFGQYQPNRLWTIDNDGQWTLKDHP